MGRLYNYIFRINLTENRRWLSITNARSGQTEVWGDQLSPLQTRPRPSLPLSHPNRSLGGGAARRLDFCVRIHERSTNAHHAHPPTCYARLCLAPIREQAARDSFHFSILMTTFPQVARSEQGKKVYLRNIGVAQRLEFHMFSARAKKLR